MIYASGVYNYIYLNINKKINKQSKKRERERKMNTHHTLKQVVGVLRKKVSKHNQQVSI